MKKTLFISLTLLAIIGLWWCTTKQTTEEYVVDQSDILTHEQIIENIPLSELNEEEKQWLLQMREEEKLARDVYIALGQQRWTKTFSNIANSEQTHTDAIKDLLDRYQIEDPVKEDIYGVFTSPTLQNLYTTLLEQGKKSLLDALIVWATIEDLDIKDLQELTKTTDNEDITLTYANLEKGSRNHLRAYVKQIQKNWWTYIPQYISQTEYETIISSVQETGLHKNQQ